MRRLGSVGHLPGACLALAVAAFTVLESSAQVATVRGSSGRPVAQASGSQASETKAGASFDFGAVFQTSGEDSVELQLASGQTITLSPGTQVRIDRGPGGPAIVVLAGSVNVVSNPALAAGGRLQPMQIVVGDSRVTFPLNTIVELAAIAQGTDGAVAVERGEASVSSTLGPVQRLGANQALRLSAQEAPRLVPTAALPAVLLARVNAAQSATVQLALANLPATAAGNQNAPINQQTTAIQSTPAATSPGGAGGCVGSGC